MKSNLHPLDRIVRGIIGIVIIAFALFNGNYIEEPFLEILLVLFGILNIISLVTSWCPVYYVVGISTSKAKT